MKNFYLLFFERAGVVTMNIGAAACVEVKADCADGLHTVHFTGTVNL